MGALRQLLTREGYVAARAPKPDQNSPLQTTDGPPVPDLSEGWNTQVFSMIGQRVRSGADDATIEAEAMTWRQPGYSETETLKEFRDLIRRWRAYVEAEPWEAQLQLSPRGIPRATMKNLKLTHTKPHHETSHMFMS